jgi:Tol biopolymer transport system component
MDRVGLVGQLNINNSTRGSNMINSPSNTGPVCLNIGLALSVLVALLAEGGVKAAEPPLRNVSPPARISGLPSVSVDASRVTYITKVVRERGEQQRNQIFLWSDDPRRRSLISRNGGGKQAVGGSLDPMISGDGSVVVFASDATDIDPGCAVPGVMNVFRQGVLERETLPLCLSIPATGGPSDGDSLYPAVSGDGRVVSWASSASNLVQGDSNGMPDVFVRGADGVIQRASIATGGEPGDGVSSLSGLNGDGSRIVFMSEATNLVGDDSNGVSDIFLRDLARGETTRISMSSAGAQANGPSYGPVFSAGGRYVGFVSAASNLVEGDSNGKRDVFLRDLDTGKTERVSVATGGGQANGDSDYVSVTADGRCVAFQSDAGNLVPGDGNGNDDVFVHDRKTGETIRVSLTSKGKEARGAAFFPVISADGSAVVFTSDAPGLTPTADRKKDDPDVYLRRLASGWCR